jgi:hypothetical protein
MNNLTSPPDLLSRVLKRINYEQELLLLQRRLVLYFGLILTSFFGFVLASRDFLSKANQTGFLPILKLATTDFGVITAHSTDYLLSLVESLPIISIALVCGVFLFLTISLIKFVGLTFKIKRLNITS